MAAFNLTINGDQKQFDVDPQMPLLWVIRDYAGLTGTKFSCGISQCGACIVHLDGEPVRSCTYPVASAEGRAITTIEGISENNDHPVQKAWIKAQVPQCGYCQSGQIMNAIALLNKNPNPSDADIDAAMRGVLCRCGTYNRVRQAIKQAVTA